MKDAKMRCQAETQKPDYDTHERHQCKRTARYGDYCPQHYDMECVQRYDAHILA
jgi:hypothetical protein